MTDDRERVEHRVDKALDRHADDVSYADLELVFQQYAQEMRKHAIDNEEMPTVSIEDIDGWAE